MCQLKRIWHWSTLIQRRWKWIQRMLEDCKWLSWMIFKQVKIEINLRKINQTVLWMCQNWLELVRSSWKLTQIWLRFDSDMTQHLFSFLASSNQLLLPSKQTQFFVLRVVNRCLWQTHFFMSQKFFKSTSFLCFNTFSLRLASIWVTTI